MRPRQFSLELSESLAHVPGEKRVVWGEHAKREESGVARHRLDSPAGFYLKGQHDQF